METCDEMPAKMLHRKKKVDNISNSLKGFLENGIKNLLKQKLL